MNLACFIGHWLVRPGRLRAAWGSGQVAKSPAPPPLREVEKKHPAVLIVPEGIAALMRITLSNAEVHIGGLSCALVIEPSDTEKLNDKETKRSWSQ